MPRPTDRFTPRAFTSANQAGDAWTRLAIDGWALWADSAIVIALRTQRLLSGGRLAEREAQRMVNEKASAIRELAAAVAKAPVASPMTTAGHAVRIAGRTVRANRRRLG